MGVLPLAHTMASSWVFSRSSRFTLFTIVLAVTGIQTVLLTYTAAAHPPHSIADVDAQLALHLRTAPTLHQDSFHDTPAFTAVNTSTRLLELQNYRAARARCDWHDISDEHAVKYMWWPTDAALKGDYWGDLTSWATMHTGAHASQGFTQGLLRMFQYLFSPAPHGAPLHTTSCVVPAEEGAAAPSSSSSSSWRIARVGPFNSTGGFDWHRTRLDDPFHLSGEDPLSVTAMFLSPVNEAGELLGNPPIHIHHADLAPATTSAAANFSRLGEWHGDSQCDTGGGGVACYLRALPAGYGYPLRDGLPLHLDADFNDARPAGSPGMQWWFETALRVEPQHMEKATPSNAEASTQRTSSPLQEVGVLILNIPARLKWWRSTDFAMTYYTPTKTFSAIWVTAFMPVSGTFATGHTYTHQDLLESAWYFHNVSPEDLGLNQGAWHLSHPWEPWRPEEHAWQDGEAAMLALKNHVLANFRVAIAACARTRCPKPPALRYVLNRTVFEIVEGVIERRGKCHGRMGGGPLREEI